MEIRSSTIERFLKSFTWSVILFVIWGWFTVRSGLSLRNAFSYTQLLWLIYNVFITLFFLLRMRPAVVSMNPLHWIVALITSFSGFCLVRSETDNPAMLHVARAVIYISILVGIATAITLGRSYDFLPALRSVKTRFLYNIVRHPMYLSSILVKLGYTLMNPAAINATVFVAITILYDQRARYEEEIMSRDNLCVEYFRKVRYRFVPGVY
jgi:protein-S-isoprenylcysteine O-methyltransferase Ste14